MEQRELLLVVVVIDFRGEGVIVGEHPAKCVEEKPKVNLDKQEEEDGIEKVFLSFFGVS